MAKPILVVKAFPSPEDLPRVISFLTSVPGLDYLTAKEILILWAKEVGVSLTVSDFDLLRRSLPE